ncbi:hypothetical protein OPIT5_01400 [Opitutaceae bacterium TAV5]|nr:hypothetical protein OPIT5_01400 [Opitutaceae bacterium TAV5]
MGESGLRAIVLDHESGIPLHLQLRDALRQAIRSAPPSVEKLPPETLLMQAPGISQATVRTAPGLTTTQAGSHAAPGHTMPAWKTSHE